MTEASASLRVEKDTPTLRELTTRKLREAILDLRFKPGEHLVERIQVRRLQGIVAAPYTDFQSPQTQRNRRF